MTAKSKWPTTGRRRLHDAAPASSATDGMLLLDSAILVCVWAHTTFPWLSFPQTTQPQQHHTPDFVAVGYRDVTRSLAIPKASDAPAAAAGGHSQQPQLAMASRPHALPWLWSGIPGLSPSCDQGASVGLIWGVSQ